ncbi:Vacuolar import and degradation protein 27 [Blastocladiella emersonii ATCC 22665]|nr:Vacuolar import and degradation protein 27 [Blastocladiella emersonii ATCC 22665]
MSMNWLRTVSSALFGGGSADGDLAVLDGALYLDRPDAAVRGTHECLFPHATLALLRDPDADAGEGTLAYILVVTRTLDEDDLVDSDSEDDEFPTNDQRAFPVGPAMRVHDGVLPDGTRSLRWVEAGGAPDEIFEFGASSETSAAVAAAFRTALLQCVYEVKFQRSHADAGDAEIEAMAWSPSPKMAVANTKRRAVTPPQDPLRVHHHIPAPTSPPARSRSTTPTPRAAPAPAPATTATAVINPPPRSLHHLLPCPPPRPPAYDLSLELDAELFLYNLAASEFALVDSRCTVQLWRDPRDGTCSWLAVDNAGGPLVAQPVAGDMNHVFYPAENAFIWNLFEVGKGCVSLSINLATDAEFPEFRRAFTAAHVQATMHATLAAMSLDDADLDYLQAQASTAGASARGGAAGGVEDDDDTDTVRGGSGSDSDDDSDGDDDVDAVDELGAGTDRDDSDEDETDATIDAATNSLLTTTSSRAYVVRGTAVGVFGFTPRNKIKYQTMIGDLSFNRTPVRPDMVLVHEGERKLVLSDARDRAKLYELDLAETIVNEWTAPDAVRGLSASTKTADRAASDDVTFLGIGERAVFRVDPRVAGGGAEGDRYKYSKPMDFTAIATTAHGHVAVTSGTGKLQMYKDVGKRATTSLQSTGESVRHLDVSLDGKYVLATCATSLLLFDVAHVTAKGVPTTAFATRMPAADRPTAIRLALRPEHVARMGGRPPSFSAAYFNVAPTGETSLVTSTGPYAVTWDLAHVLRGGRHRDWYTVKPFDADVVADQFKFGDDRNVVVALPDDVMSVNRRKMERVVE